MSLSRRLLPALLFVSLCLLPNADSLRAKEASGAKNKAKKSSGQTADVSTAAATLLQSLDADQRGVLLLPADSPQQVQWHFIPKDQRKGLELNKMTAQQRQMTHQLLQALLSQSGYKKTTQIMNLERLLKELQTKRGGGGPIRDHLRYYVTYFGQPGASRWGISFEGHHLSLNFALDKDRVVSSSPQFFATNPAIVKSPNRSDIDLGTRVLRLEETLAFELVNSLSADQRKTAIIAEKAPAEIRAAGEAQPPQTAAEGIAWRELSSTQRQQLRRLIGEYIRAVPERVAAERSATLKGTYRSIHFAWAGPTVPGIGHYYRIQGKHFLIEFVNTQPDADGNPANHVHCVWRDLRGDFGKSATGE